MSCAKSLSLADRRRPDSSAGGRSKSSNLGTRRVHLELSESLLPMVRATESKTEMKREYNYSLIFSHGE